MITFELAQELKAAGFPQRYGDGIYHYYEPDGTKMVYVTKTVESDFARFFYIVPLEELIEACGNGRIALVRPVLGLWEAQTSEWRANGSTPEEAVARLYLALNKK